jgi:hypothetical protein
MIPPPGGTGIKNTVPTTKFLADLARLLQLPQERKNIFFLHTKLKLQASKELVVSGARLVVLSSLRHARHEIDFRFGAIGSLRANSGAVRESGLRKSWADTGLFCGDPL